MKKTIAVTAAAMLLSCNAISFTSYAADAESASVTFNIVDNKGGKILVADEKVDVSDVDNDGKLTIYDAFITVHDEKFEGGSEKGFAVEGEGTSSMITLLWGIENNTGFGYYQNDAVAWSLYDTIADGDEFTAFIYKDTTNWSDAYSFFDKKSADLENGEEIELTLNKSVWNVQENKPENLPVEGAVITIDGVDSDLKTDANGKVKVKAEKAGKTVFGAKTDDAIIVSPVFTANVKGEETTTEPVATTTEPASTETSSTTSETVTSAVSSTSATSTSSSNSPKTGDAGVGTVIAGIGVAALAAFVVRKKNED